MLKLGGLSFVVNEGKLDLGMLFGPGIDLAGSLGEIVALRRIGGMELAGEEKCDEEEVLHGAFFLEGAFAGLAG